jgi:wobble nucleotide-excising tRNase
MLVKINHIKNVGRFYEVVPKGTPESNPTFELFNLLYADNGTGKTTLCSIIKSLAYNDPSRILTRKTIPGNHNCEVSLRIDHKECNFLNESWNKQPDSKFAFFDEEFIERSVFSPSGIDSSHKRELYNYVVLGEENVAKAEEMQLLVETELPSKTKEINSLETQLKQAAGINDIKTLIDLIPLSLQDFQKLKMEVELKNVQIKNSESIRAHKLLSKLPNISWPNFSQILNKGLQDIGSIEKYEAHILNHQKWIKEGFNIQDGGSNCPYCFQDVSKSEIVNTYKQFFSIECQLLIDQLNQLATDLKTNFATDKTYMVEKIIDGNKDSCHFWQAMDKDIPANISFISQYASKLEYYCETVLRLIELKLKNILKPLEISNVDQAHLSIEMEITNAINSYNQNVDLLNKKIEAIKTNHSDLNALIQTQEDNQLKLICQEVAFTNENTKLLIQRYKTIVKEKHECLSKLNLLRDEINVESLRQLTDYRIAINKLLQSFGVEFRIEKVEQKIDTARKDNLSFSIELKGLTFDPNGSRKTPYKITNTLSSGDKTTLAFALFMAKLQHADLNNTIVIFDDPISSLDFFRKQQTSKQISAISKKAKQVIVLTHSMEFTKLFNHVPVKSKYFKIFKADSMAGIVLTPYDKLSDMCISKHYDEHDTIEKYLSMPSSVDRLDVMKSIRSYVETKLCIYRPELIKQHPATLGKFIAYLKLQNIEQLYIDDLEIINDSIVIENHGSSPLADDHANLTDEELRNLCKLALNLSAPPT